MPPLYRASVPTFLHYLDRTEGLVRQVRHDSETLQARLAPDMFSAAEQFATAAGFSLRIAFPLAEMDAPETPDLGMDGDGLLARLAFSRDHLNALEPGAFDGAEERRIVHRAGFAELDQAGDEFLHLFGLPNFLFHISMGFAVLRQKGVEIGKADFDGLHDYPPGFRF